MDNLPGTVQKPGLRRLINILLLAFLVVLPLSSFALQTGSASAQTVPTATATDTSTPIPSTSTPSATDTPAAPATPPAPAAPPLPPGYPRGYKVEVSLDGTLPGARPDLSVDGTIEIERLKDVLYVGRPSYGQAESTVGMFRLSPDGTEATRVNVKLGRSSVNTIEIKQGLNVHDRVIISDMSAMDAHEKVRVQ